MGNQLPVGTVTFLFTDIVGSTPLWEQQPEQMSEALQVHNAILRSAIEAHGGVVFKTVGDAFQAAFPTAPQALRAAISGKNALKTAGWNELGELKVRMGLHTGEAELDPGGDEYAVSHSKNRVARIMSAAHGGQVLLSQETKDLVDHQLPEKVTLKDLGEHRLKGMEWLERLYQICAPGLQEAFPALSTTISYPHNLPLQLTSFIGREKEMAAVQRLLNSHRLVTLTGSGGTGKSRLSLEVAAQCLEQYPNGVWLVELAPLADPDLIPKTVASALNLPEIPGKTVTQAVVDFLRPKHLLLILDNCEHLLDACTELADTLIHACPELTILASSREFLGVEGEAPYRVPPLSLPDARNLPSSETLSGYDAVRLFIERARLASPEFDLQEANAAVVAQVVSRLDGIPLAIELAAVRLKLLGVEQLAERMNDTFRLLTGGSRSKLPRHQTLRACIDWSYNLLSEPERILLRRLSVFAGGWSLQAAEEVCAGGILLVEDILDLLSELLDKSLIHAETVTNSRKRYSMLETVRQYAHEKLVDEGETEEIRTAHLRFFVKFAETLEPKLRSREQIETLNRLEVELDNLRLALEWGLNSNVQAELRLAAALKWFWSIHHHNSEGADWLERGLELYPARIGDPDASRDCLLVRAKGLEVLGFHYGQVFNYLTQNPALPPKIRTLLEESISIYRSFDDKLDPAARRGLGWALLYTNHKNQVIEAMEIFRLAGDVHGMAESLQFMAWDFDPSKQKPYYMEQLALDKDNGDIEGIATALNSLGVCLFFNAEYEQALVNFQESQGYYQLVENKNMITFTVVCQGIASFYLGNLAQTRQKFEQGLGFGREYGIERIQTYSITWLSRLEIAEGRFKQAAGWLEQLPAVGEKGWVLKKEIDWCRLRLRLQAGSSQQRKLVEQVVSDPALPEIEKLLPMMELGHIELDDKNYERAGVLWREGLQVIIRSEDGFWLPLFLDALALLASRQGEDERAVRLFGTRWCQGGYHLLTPGKRAEREAEFARLRETLGEERFEQLFQQGRELAFQQAIDLALEETSG